MTALLSRAGLAALLVLALPLAASAYTLVLRSGRRVTIPDNFRVTPSAVVYEASPGFSVTVWLSNVDTAATEKANAEPAGSFVARVEREQEGAGAAGGQGPTQTARTGAPRVVTNRELEPSRLKREAQEAEYERTRRERGLPSRRELQGRVEEQDRRLREWARQAEAERLEAELESLRTELTHVRRQLNGLSLNLSQRAESYGPAYAPPHVYPYFYAPPVALINVFPHVHRSPFGRQGFRPHQPHARPWPSGMPSGQAFPRGHANPSAGVWAAPLPVPPAGRAHGPRH